MAASAHTHVSRLLRQFGGLVFIGLLGGFLGSSLIHLAPGFGIDEQELNSGLSTQSIHALRGARRSDENIFSSYAQYLNRAAHGDLGVSWSLRRPVTELIGQRAPTTFRSVFVGLTLAWIVSLTLSILTVARERTALNLFATVFSGLLICIPPAMLALPLAYVSGPVAIALAICVFPKTYRYSRNILGDVAASPHVLQAEASGLTRSRLLWFHILANSRAQLVAVAGISVSVALAIAVPIEVICDSPGIGQLAWQAALGRDLPLLTTLTILVCVVALAANHLADALGATELTQTS